jgi:C-terminal processing protease CtpA/Prc
MFRRLSILIAALSCLCAAQPSYERLAAAAKLWAYVKYCHPTVTSSDVDWDAALVLATPKILDAKTDSEFSTAVGEMLAALKDPATHMLSMAEMMGQGRTRIKPVVSTEDGITLVRLETGDFQQTMQNRAALTRELTGKGTVLFDLRGTKLAQYALPESLPVAKAATAPARMMRAHSGYANDANSGSGGYQSYWETRDGAMVPAAASGGLRAIFLVDHDTAIPEIALAMQTSGAGAIVSEDAIDDGQLDLNRPFPVQRQLYAAVRIALLSYRDGTTGLTANAVLHQTGDAALKAALQMAKSPDWPAPGARPKLSLPPARFVEKTYAEQALPGAEYRMLAAARIWGVFHYFHPYRHLYGEDWDAVLTEFLPKMAHAEKTADYHLAVAEMVAHVHDTHCFVNSPELAQFFGAAAPPVELRWIENQPVVTRVLDSYAGVSPGDVLTKIDGEPYQKRADDLAKHIAASTTQSMMSRVMSSLLRGPAGSTIKVTVRTGNDPEHEVTLTRTAGVRFNPYRAGDAFRLLDPHTGYVDLEKLTNAQVDAMFDMFKDTDAIIMDMRGYPQGTAWSVAPRLAETQAVVAAHFQRNLVTPDMSEDTGIMSLTFEQRIPATAKPRYKGKTVMLIDERAISQSEHSGLFYRAANGTKFIGSPTTGANGDVTFFTAPGGIRINFSGHDVRWPDGKQLQRAGLTPDVEVHPTIAGIRAGRDEVLERAIVYVKDGK